MANALVGDRLAACVNVLPLMQSIYRWEGVVQTETEHLLLIKTTAERFPALEERILKLHTYETPEVLAVPIAGGSEKYLAWLRQSVQDQNVGYS